MEKEFVPYELAVKLKELGFDEPCLCSWNFYTNELNFNGQPSTFSSEDVIQLPTFSQAFRWFRDNKLSDACVCRYQSRDDRSIFYYYCINHDFGIEETKHFKEGFFSYEEAELACLDKLIEIVELRAKVEHGVY